ncbi:MAG: gliding motility-associated C-terminal domain-containing protein [Bacteroidia bacterium]|nr:gliding motility-associated C-terminal domain-containing protein [Bacteroidia bacterium]
MIKAQKQGNIWYFGKQCGLDFSGGTPVVIYGGQIGSDVPLWDVQEGTSSIADSSGNLLFYTGGKTIWNKNHIPMLNGTGLMGGTSSTQSSLIIPRPGSNNIFYVFTSDEYQSYPSSKGYRYSIVDMCLDNGKGAVITGQKNILLCDSSTEKISACIDANETGYWIMGHKMFSNEFHAWHLTSGGITDTVISKIGTVHGWDSSNLTWITASSQGEMKFNPLGTKLALAISNFDPAYFDLFDFNNGTGTVSNFCHMVLDSLLGKRIWGCAFSPDGSKLYASVSGGAGGKRLYQFDMTAGNGNCDSVKKSIYTLFQENNNSVMFGLQTAPNGKIYAVANSYFDLSCINNPNTSGFAADFDTIAIKLSGQNNYELPNFIAGYKYHNPICNCPLSLTSNSTNTSCNNQCTGTANAITWGGTAPFTYLWSNGQTSPTATTLCAGNYSVTVTDGAGSSITSSVSISQPPALNLTFSKNNTCSGAATGSATLTVTGGTPAYSYLWSNGKRSPALTKLPAGVFTLTLTDKNACTTIDSVAIGTFPLPSASITGDSIICTGQLTTLTASGGSSYKWSTGDTTSSISVSPPLSSLCTVTVTDANSCSATATYTVTVNPRPTVTLTHDTVILAGDSVQLTASGGLTYLWQPATSLNYNTIANPIAAPAQTTTYTLTITDINGCVNTATCTVFVKPPCLGSERDVFIPNIFSPNNDGKNDVLKIEGNGLTSIYWAIFDRWGNLFFETRDQSRGWDGNKNGTPALSGTYVYYLKAVCIKTNTEIKLKGNVSLVR